MMKKGLIFFLFFIFIESRDVFSQNISIPSLNLGINSSSDPNQVSLSLQVLILLSILSLAPSIIIMLTCFIRIVVVLSFVKIALSLQQLPPNQVIIGLSIFLSLFIMMPTFNKIYENGYKPFLEKKLSIQEFYNETINPIREFMFNQIGKKDRKLLVPFIKMSKIQWPRSQDDVPTYILIPAFILSEIKKAFYIGILIFIPFIIIDLFISSILMSMGMIMLPPVMISLPFKIILFVLIDGWNLIINQLIRTFII